MLFGAFLSGGRAKRQQADNSRPFSAWLWARLAKSPRAEEGLRYYREFHLTWANARGCAVDHVDPRLQPNQIRLRQPTIYHRPAHWRRVHPQPRAVAHSGEYDV
jgi:hypothetical protein